MTAKLVICTTANKEEAKKIAQCLVKEQFAACVNIIPGILSVYKWEGQIQNDNEHLLLIKTISNAISPLKEKIMELHSYSVPEIIVLDITEGSNAYLNWVGQNVKY
ncbi:MAG: divalent-cation tolerance protein CutA [Calditrichia bacterium]|nr:divalent-cation tolerance protein CutA [Calditrichia bacterium]